MYYTYQLILMFLIQHLLQGQETPEVAGMTTREIVNVIRGLSGLNLISADVVEVSPAYDHAEVTSLAAATIVYELINLFAKVKG